jgi:hypothetical protein
MLSPSSPIFRSVCLNAHMMASMVVRKTSGEACAKCINAGKQCLLIDSTNLLQTECSQCQRQDNDGGRARDCERVKAAELADDNHARRGGEGKDPLEEVESDLREVLEVHRDHLNCWLEDRC